jgi:hypothetical protein
VRRPVHFGGRSSESIWFAFCPVRPTRRCHSDNVSVCQPRYCGSLGADPGLFGPEYAEGDAGGVVGFRLGLLTLLLSPSATVASTA